MSQVDLVFRQIKKDLDLFRYSAAMVKLAGLSKTHNKDLDYLILLAQTQKALGEFTNLIKTLEIIVGLRGSSSDFIELMRAMYSGGRLNEALDIALFLQEYGLSGKLSEGEDRAVTHCLVKIYLEFSDFEGLQEVLGACDYIAKDSLLLRAMGLLFWELDDRAEALSFFVKSIDIENTNDQAWLNIAMLHKELGNDAMAWDCLEKVIELNSNNAAALKLMVDWHNQEPEKINKVIYALRRYLCKFEFDEEISLCYVQMLKKINDMNSVRIELEKLILYHPVKLEYQMMKKNFEVGMKTS